MAHELSTEEKAGVSIMALLCTKGPDVTILDMLPAIRQAMADEREACAQLAGAGVRKEDSPDSTEWQKGYADGYWDAKKAIAAAVRMRGQ